ncbi:MAG: hypothetical protein DRO98_08340, partial [Archaeoglobales archaeon]
FKIRYVKYNIERASTINKNIVKEIDNSNVKIFKLQSSIERLRIFTGPGKEGQLPPQKVSKLKKAMAEALPDVAFSLFTNGWDVYQGVKLIKECKTKDGWDKIKSAIGNFLLDSTITGTTAIGLLTAPVSFWLSLAVTAAQAGVDISEYFILGPYEREKANFQSIFMGIGGAPYYTKFAGYRWECTFFVPGGIPGSGGGGFYYKSYVKNQDRVVPLRHDTSTSSYESVSEYCLKKPIYEKRYVLPMVFLCGDELVDNTAIYESFNIIIANYAKEHDISIPEAIKRIKNIKDMDTYSRYYGIPDQYLDYLEFRFEQYFKQRGEVPPIDVQIKFLHGEFERIKKLVNYFKELNDKLEEALKSMDSDKAEKIEEEINKFLKDNLDLDIPKEKAAPTARERADDTYDVSTSITKPASITDSFIRLSFEKNRIDLVATAASYKLAGFETDYILNPETIWAYKKSLEQILERRQTVFGKLSNEELEVEQLGIYEVNFTIPIIDYESLNVLEIEKTLRIPYYSASLFKNHPEFERLYFWHLLSSIKDDFWSLPDIAILRSGEYESIMNFMLENGIYVSLLDPDDDYGEMRSFKVILIPSGSIDELVRNKKFIENLNAYVYNGGKLIVFTQIKGADYSILPRGDEIEAFGYMEDQSCRYKSSIIDTYMPFLASQTKAKPDFSVDGYFMKVPENSTIVLRRVKNNQPSMIIYDYGFGKVIATTLYSDIAYTMHQMTRDEKNLILDLINWCLDEDMETFDYGDDVKIKFNATNYGLDPVDKVEVTIVDSSGRSVFSESMDVTINPNETKVIEFSAGKLKPGTYSLNYVTFTNGNVSYIGVDEKKFAVLYYKPFKGGYTADRTIYASLQSDGEIYPVGATAHMKLIIWNYGSEDKTVNAKIRHHIFGPWRGKDYTVVVPANGYT